MVPQQNGTESSNDFVRLFWCDFAGVRRCRVVTYKVYKGDVGDMGLGLVECVMALPVWGDVVAPNSGYSVTGVVRLLPDKIYHNSSKEGAFCVTNLMTSVGANKTTFKCCPRSILKQCEGVLKQQTGLSLRVGFEHEFNLLNKQDLSPIDHSVYCQATAFSDASQVLFDMVNGLEQVGTGVYQFHAESASGQYEIATDAFGALEACDRCLLSKDIISNVANSHQKKATFIPKLFEMQAGNGGHIHFSLNTDEGENVTGDGSSGSQLSEVGSQFVAGVLHYLPSLCVFLLPSVNSYERMQAGCWSGAFQIWGHENKEAPIRVIVPPKGHDFVHVEIKACDASTNPYIGVACVIAAGLAGISAKMELPAETDFDPGCLSVEECNKRGYKQLPSSLQEAIDVFEQDEQFQQIVTQATSAEFVKCFLAVRKSEDLFFKERSLQQQIDILKFRYS
eukprot:TRINITY_DN3342_c0_g1_i1.p1 TRINITY_DN3342_c0_g1~~TRINITY_DN3342_c0_g1_i1.p1  ORF type:complete len:450 (-),score=90.25 TRINITY_DN3342_c0_g1_i1:487-1836(-)